MKTVHFPKSGYTYSSDEQPAGHRWPPELYLSPARIVENILLMLAKQTLKMTFFFFSDLVHFARIVKFGKEYTSGNRI
jgi:hypothetical protein